MQQWIKGFAVVIFASCVAVVTITNLVATYRGEDLDRPYQPNQVSTNYPGKPAGGERGTQDYPFFVQVIPSLKSDAEAAQDTRERDEKAKTDTWLVRFTGLLFFVGVAQAVVFWIQAGRLKETIDAMKAIDQGQSEKIARSIAEASRAASAMEGVAEQMRRSVIAAFKTAEAGEETARAGWDTGAASGKIASTAKDTAERQLRAYIGVEPFGEDGIIRTGSSPEVQIRMINHGLTPANKFNVLCNADIFPEQAGPELNRERVVAPSNGGVLHPRAEYFFMAKRPEAVSADEDAKMHTGEKAFHVWGEVLYEDVFGQQRTTKFHFTFGGAQAFTLRRMGMAPEGNEAT